ncbi:MAG: protein-L-isoaspartate(D-aspartate) O-methyltransferase [Chthoniobacterales bacterium]
MAVRQRNTALCLLMALAVFTPVLAPAREFATDRARMVREQIAMRGVTDQRVLEAMGEVPREQFVPEETRGRSYSDRPMPIGYDQTISQPYIVAFMTEKLQLKPTDRVLEIGTGSGYHAAILGELAAQVYTIEIVEPLGKRAAATLARLGHRNVHVRIGDGYKGWLEHAPYDAVIVTCAPDHVPLPLIEQTKEGGRIIIPVGSAGGVQELYLLEKKNGELKRRSVLPVRFVPMTGKASEPR